MADPDLRNVLNKEDGDKVTSSGMDLSEKTRSASFLQQDDDILFSKSLFEGVDIVKMEEALERYPGVRNYYGKSFKMLNKEYPADTAGGYFIRVMKGAEVSLPIQACLFLKKQAFEQKVHNMIIIEEGARVYLITGCSASEAARGSFHLGISEFFVQKGAYLNFTMIHSWREDVSVRPMSVAVVEEGGSFISNYVCLKPVRDITMYPTAVLMGHGARASFNSLILSHPDTLQDIGARVIFKSSETYAEIVSRAVSLGGKVVARGHLKAENPGVRAHLECRGLVLSEEGTIHAIPELETDLRDVDLSHEAAIGRISKEEIEYLCSRGMTPDQAQSVIIRGFMDVDILALPELLKDEIKQLEDQTLQGGL